MMRVEDALEALASARHSDPFSLLGPHRLDGDRAVIRTFQPAAERVAVVRDGREHEMTRRHPSGIYELVLDHAPDVILGAAPTPDREIPAQRRV